MERTNIINFVEGTSVNQMFYLKEITTATASNGKPYSNITLADVSGEIAGKMWSVVNGLGPGIVSANVKVSTYQGKLQVVADSIVPVQDVSPVEVAKLVPASPYSISWMESMLTRIIETIEDDEYRTLVNSILNDRINSLRSLPAAKSMHHNFIGGWLQHTTEMAYTANQIAKIYPVIDRDILITGTILHDIGKLEEFHTTDVGLVDIYSDIGMMQGHLYIGANIVKEYGAKINMDEKKVNIIQHMILAHHGNPEWGAVTRPCTPEAAALFLVDMISARMEMFRTEYPKLEPYTMAEAANRGLDNVRVYKSSECNRTTGTWEL